VKLVHVPYGDVTLTPAAVHRGQSGSSAESDRDGSSSDRGAQKDLGPPQPPSPSPWAENGAIWLLPNLLVGFTSYAAVSAFFANVQN
jgi:hypothetical protein